MYIYNNKIYNLFSFYSQYKKIINYKNIFKNQDFILMYINKNKIK